MRGGPLVVGRHVYERAWGAVGRASWRSWDEWGGQAGGTESRQARRYRRSRGPGRVASHKSEGTRVPLVKWHARARGRRAGRWKTGVGWGKTGGQKRRPEQGGMARENRGYSRQEVETRRSGEGASPARQCADARAAFRRRRAEGRGLWCAAPASAGALSHEENCWAGRRGTCTREGVWWQENTLRRHTSLARVRRGARSAGARQGLGDQAPVCSARLLMMCKRHAIEGGLWGGCARPRLGGRGGTAAPPPERPSSAQAQGERALLGGGGLACRGTRGGSAAWSEGLVAERSRLRRARRRRSCGAGAGGAARAGGQGTAWGGAATFVASSTAAT